MSRHQWSNDAKSSIGPASVDASSLRKTLCEMTDCWKTMQLDLFDCWGNQNPEITVLWSVGINASGEVVCGSLTGSDQTESPVRLPEPRRIEGRMTLQDGSYCCRRMASADLNRIWHPAAHFQGQELCVPGIFFACNCRKLPSGSHCSTNCSSCRDRGV